MSNYYYHIDIFIKPSKIGLFEESFTKILQAYKRHSTGKHHQIHLQRTLIGGDDVITLTIEMDSLDEIGAWGHTPAIVIEQYGDQEGIAILDNYCQSMDSWQSRVTKPVYTDK